MISFPRQVLDRLPLAEAALWLWSYSEKPQLNANDAAIFPWLVTLPRFTPPASPPADDPCTSSGTDAQRLD
jgi:hypothetical protein